MCLRQSLFSKIFNFKYMLREQSLKLNVGLHALQNWVLTLSLWMGKLVMNVWFIVWEFSLFTQEGTGTGGVTGNHNYWWTVRRRFRSPFKITAKHVSRYKISRSSFFNIWILKKISWKTDFSVSKLSKKCVIQKKFAVICNPWGPYACRQTFPF